MPIELKTLSVSPRPAMQQIVDYENDPGNGYIRTGLCFVHRFAEGAEHMIDFNDEQYLAPYPGQLQANP